MANQAEQHPNESAFRILLREVGTRLSDSLSDHPAAAKRSFAIIMIVGFLALLGLEIGLALLGAAQFGQHAPSIDQEVMRWFDQLPIRRASIHWLDVWGNALVTWPVAFFAAGFLAWRKRPFRALAFLPGYAATEVYTLIGWWVWSRPRPQMAGGESIDWSSFPSGHVIHVVYILGLLCWGWSTAARGIGEKIVAWTIFSLVSLAIAGIRLRMATHWPSDVTFSLFIGAAWLAVAVAAIRRAEAQSGNTIPPANA